MEEVLATHPVLRLGLHRFSVRMVGPEFLGDDTIGQSDSQYNRILLLRGIPNSRLAETLIHEVAHVIIEGLGLGADDDERVCCAIGPGILQFIRDNPRLISCLINYTD